MLFVKNNKNSYMHISKIIRTSASLIIHYSAIIEQSMTTQWNYLFFGEISQSYRMIRRLFFYLSEDQLREA